MNITPTAFKDRNEAENATSYRLLHPATEEAGPGLEPGTFAT